ncbi:hypothetical protein JCM11251_007586 [Rhodosporidiobolus azoricus]
MGSHTPLYHIQRPQQRRRTHRSPTPPAPPLPIPHPPDCNQALLLAPTNPSPLSGQHLRLQLRSLLTHLNTAHPTVLVCFVWCPGHEGVGGKELVDLIAKEAAEEGARRAEGAMTRKATRGHRGRSRTAGRQAVAFRALLSTQESVSSEGSEWGGDEEVSEKWAKRSELRVRGGGAGRDRALLLKGEVEGGWRMPKSVSALKQAQRKATMTEWRRRWLGKAGIGSHAFLPPSNASPSSTSTPTTPSDPTGPAATAASPSSFGDAPFSPSPLSFSPPPRPPSFLSPSPSGTHPSFALSTTPTTSLPSPGAAAAAFSPPLPPRPGNGLRAVDRRPPGLSFVRHLHQLPRRSATLLSRLRLDFCDLGGTKQMLAADDPLQFCECGNGVETRDHYLLECKRYDVERRQLAAAVRKAGGGALSITTIFLPRFTPFLLRFLHSSHRFPSLFDQLDTPIRSSSP